LRLKKVEMVLRVPVVLALGLLAGCSGRVYLGQVEGTVRAGGQPLDNVLITFVPAKDGEHAAIRSMAVTDAEGRYRLKTEQQLDGALVGPHKVIIEDLAIYQAKRSPDGTVTDIPPERFGPRYSDPLRSPLSHDVQPGQQTIDLELQ
jgi:hypothetical protein